MFACNCGNGNAVTAVQSPIVEFVAEDALVEWDTMIHDFGDVSVNDGPLTCTFTLTNKSDEPVAIYEVVSSCGCTGVSWTKAPIKKGESGTITATYKNEDGPMPFDKSLTVYISGVKRPVVLRLRGVVHEKKKSLSELFGEQRLGDFGLKTRRFEAPILRQGLQVSAAAEVANLGKTPMKVSFADVAPNLSVSVAPNPIPAGSKASMTYTISADRKLWGRNTYSATPVINGRKSAVPLIFTAATQENFALLSAKEKSDSPLPMFTMSTVSFGTAKKGKVLTGEFTAQNKGKTPLVFYKADSESEALSTVLPQSIAPGETGKISFSLETSEMPLGENVIMISLVTNSALRPVVNIFVAGILE